MTARPQACTLRTAGATGGRSCSSTVGRCRASPWGEQLTPGGDAGFRVVVDDRRGFGRSRTRGDGYDYDKLAGDLDNVLDRP